MRIVTTCPFCFTRFIVQQKQVEAQQGEVDRVPPKALAVAQGSKRLQNLT